MAASRNKAVISAIVLAAGRSARMGTQKLLLPVGHQPLITRIVDELLGSPARPITVVVGKDEALIRQALQERDVAITRNPDDDSDMLGSVRCGLRALPEPCAAIMVVLGDQPGITRGLVADLIHAFQSTGRRIIVPTYAGRRGHPLLFASSLRNEVLVDYDGIGLHGLLQAHPNEVLELSVPSAVMLEDLDTPEDYERLRHRPTGGSD